MLTIARKPITLLPNRKRTGRTAKGSDNVSSASRDANSGRRTICPAWISV